MQETLPDWSTPNARLKWARVQAGYPSIRNAANKRGWNENTYKAHEQGINNFHEDDARRYGKGFSVNWVWLLHNIGDPKGKASDAAASATPQSTISPDIIGIREIDISVGAGGGGEAPIAYKKSKNGTWTPTDAVKAEAFFPMAWLESLGLDPNFTDLVRVRGDSMYPEIDDGDWVFVDRRVHQLSADDIYLLWDGFGVVAKSLAVVRGKRPPRVKIISANPKYPPEEIALDEIHIIGRVHFRLGRIIHRR